MSRILIVNPATPGKYVHNNRGGFDRIMQPLIRRYINKDFTFPVGSNCTLLPPITLLGLKSLFSKHSDVEIVDEQVESIMYDSVPDMVCITATTLQINRAIEISKRFRNIGIKTAIGGVHASLRPQDCVGHFDVVCIGEAESYVEKMISDLDRGKLTHIYQNKKLVPMDTVPFYSYEIGGGKYLPVHVISFSRGCKFSCDFCSIGNFYGSYRTRNIESIVKEIERVGAKYIWFPDATITGDMVKTKFLLEALSKLNIRWFSQATTNVLDNNAFLDLMAKSGCMAVSIGFESLNENNLRSSNKTQNRVNTYQKIVNELKSRSISVEGNFVFGFDEDRKDTFDQTAEFIVNSGIDLPQIFVLTPYPNTKLFEKLDTANRIVDKNWSNYDNMHFRGLPVFLPKNMSREELRDGCLNVERTVFSIQNTLQRIINSADGNFLIGLANYILASRVYRDGHLDVKMDELCTNNIRVGRIAHVDSFT